MYWKFYQLMKLQNNLKFFLRKQVFQFLALKFFRNTCINIFYRKRGKHHKKIKQSEKSMLLAENYQIINRINISTSSME